MNYKLEKPFTDKKENYTIINTDMEKCYELINLENGHKHIVNPFDHICDCNDFKFRTNGGSCKHIDFLIDSKQMQPLFKEYEKIMDELRLKNNTNQPNQPNKPNMIIDDIENQYIIMEKRDENQILSELKGNVLQEFVYSFKQGNKEITGLSYAGVKQIALQMGNIHCSEPLINEMNGSWICKVKAIDITRNLEMWGVSSQCKTMHTSYGDKPDEFAVQKAVSKAERNALRKLMPEKIIISMIKEWRINNGGNQ